MVEVVVTILHGKTPKVIIKEINQATEEMDIISKEANEIESGIINKINHIGTRIIEILIGTTVIINKWLNQQTVTTIDMMNDGEMERRQVEENEIIMAVVTHPNVSSTLKAVAGRVMLVKQLLTIRPLVVVFPVTITAKVEELMVSTSRRAIIHATAPSSQHHNMITVLVLGNQGAEAEAAHQSSVAVIQD